MDRGKVSLLIHTLKYLRPKQFIYRVFYFVRNRFFKKKYSKFLTLEMNPLVWNDVILNSNSFIENNSFIFLNIKYSFGNQIDWNFDEFGKLWTFNLNYFDFLNQHSINVEKGVELIKDYIIQDKNLLDGKASYPISLRGINWIKFLSKNKIQDLGINQALYNHFQILYHNPEYHLLGNHLFENGFSLLFGAYYFKDEQFYKKAVKILKSELNEQILEDGGHFELSPMYHQTMLFRILDCVHLLQSNNWKQDNLINILKDKSLIMLSWLHEVTFSNGDIPMVNDSTFEISPNSIELFEYAKKIQLKFDKINLSDSGYRMFKNNKFELFMDVGDVGASYQPAHVHSDTFNFVLYVNEQPIIVDRGISTYEKNKIRQQERETASHNTVKIGNQEQTEVWGGFRVANRAKVIHLKEDKNFIEATHNGYLNKGVLHTRKFITNTSSIIINDEISKKIKETQIAFFHLHPDLKDINISENEVVLKEQNIQIVFKKNVIKVEIDKYNYSLGFNKVKQAQKIKVYFKNFLETEIKL